MAANTGMHNLTTLIKRLEAATSRLEDIATSASSYEGADGAQTSRDGVPATASAPDLTILSKEATPTQAQPKQSLPQSIQDMDALIKLDLATFVNATKDLDSNITDQAAALARAFQAQRQFLLVATKAKKPDMTSSAFQGLLSGLQHEMGTVTDIKDTNRASQYRDQLNMVGEGMGALQWIFYDFKPADYVGEVLGGVQMFGNRVLKEYREKDPAQVTFVQTYYALWKALREYIQKHYQGGLTWNDGPSGLELSEALKQIESEDAPTTNGAAAAPTAAAGGPPPPPPPPPPPLPTFDAGGPPPPPPPPAAKSGAAGGDMGAVFDQLNRGEAVTAGLKKVDKSQMTHKNPTLRAGGAVPERQDSSDSLGRSRSTGPSTKPKPESMRAKGGATPKKEGRKELDGNKWYIENFEDAAAPIEIEVSLSQSVLISRCKNTTIRLAGKANAVSIDNSTRTNLIIDSLVSSVDVVKAPNFALQVLGNLPTIMLDQVDGASVYLSKDSLNTEIYTSKCSGVNVNLPPKSEQEDYREVPLPEQIRTFVKNGVLVSEIVEHAG